MQLVPATTPDQLEQCRALFREYAAWLEVDLCFQGFAAELASLPGAYAPPSGRLLLAMEGTEVAGCAGLRPLSTSACELKRFYVRPPFRRQGFGRSMGSALLQEASSIGYSAVFLDTLPTMLSAIRLYESLGFERCPAYYQTPIPETVFMKLNLKSLKSDAAMIRDALSASCPADAGYLFKGSTIL